MKNKVKITKFKGGGYVRTEKIDEGITGLEMDGKGWAAMFGDKLWGGLEKRIRRSIK